jgi:large subunit ribosomal protein L10
MGIELATVLRSFFRENKKKRAAKAGDVAPFEIVVPAGDTDLPPGPALSELKNAGLNVMIKAGKIVVSKDSVVAKTGEKITIQKASALQKLNIMPFEIMANLRYGYDGKYVYSKEVLDVDVTLNQDLVRGYQDAFNLSLNAGIPTQGNIQLLLGNAFRQGVSLAINADIYSSSSIEQLLALAFKQGMAFESLKEEKK